MRTVRGRFPSGAEMVAHEPEIFDSLIYYAEAAGNKEVVRMLKRANKKWKHFGGGVYVWKGKRTA